MVALVATCTVACGAGPASQAAPRADAALLRLVDKAAGANQEVAVRVEALRTTRGSAAPATGLDFNPEVARGEDVWVVQSENRRQDGSTGWVAMLVRADDLSVSDTAFGPRASDLSVLGAVRVLRER